MAKDAVSEHSDHDSSAHPVSERDDVSRLQEEPSRERWRREVEESAAGASASSSSAALGTDLASDAAPIVGVAAQDDVRPPIRPRFKTLMGVPRNDPNLELYADKPLLNAALLEADEREPAAGSSVQDAALQEVHTAAELSSETAQVLEDADAGAEDLEDAAAPEVHDEQVAAATGTPVRIEKLSSTVRLPREALGQFAAIAPASFDLRDDVAALRRTSSARRWLLALGGICAAAALTFYLPREWRLLLHSPPPIRQDDAALLVTSWQATQTLEALRPTSSSSAAAQAIAPASAAFPATTASAIRAAGRNAAGQQPEARRQGEPKGRGDAKKQARSAASPSPAGASSVASVLAGSSGSTEHAPAPSGGGKSLRNSSAKAPHTEHPHAAPRKVIAGRSGPGSGAREQARMKALESRQNPPRNAGGNGIIRDTPF